MDNDKIRTKFGGKCYLSDRANTTFLYQITSQRMQP
jgi:hypothetical protein